MSDEIVYIMPESLRVVDHNDFSFRARKKYDKIDGDRVDKLNYVGKMGKDKAKSERSKFGSRHLGRWGFKG